MLCNLSESHDFKMCLKICTKIKKYLAHEIRDDAMKYGALVAKVLLSSAQCTEVFCKIVISSW